MRYANAIDAQVNQEKEKWLDHHLRTLLGNEVCDKAIAEPAVVRSLMRDKMIWLRESGNKTELMVEDKVYSKFILEIKAR